jgi:hypothetical protein
MPRPARIVQHGASDGDHIGFLIRDDGFRLLRFSDQSNGNRRHADLSLHSLGIGDLIARSELDCLRRRNSSGGYMDSSAAPALKSLRESNRSFDIPAAGNPVGRRNPDPDWLVCGKSVTDGIEYLEREAHSVFETAAVFVLALVRNRREELVEQIAVGSMDLDGIEA